MGLSIDTLNKYNVTPLQIAISEGHVDFAKFLLRQGANIGPIASSDEEDGMAALHYACIYRRAEIAKILIDFGADCNALDANHWTPLHYAARADDLSVVSLLLNKKVSLDVPSVDSKQTALHLCSKNREIAEKLMNAGSSCNAQDAQGKSFLHYAVNADEKEIVDLTLSRENVLIDLKDADGMTPLMWAVKKNSKDCVFRLLAKGADVNARLQDGSYPLMCAQFKESYYEVIEMLLKARSFVNEPKTIDGTTPIIMVSCKKVAKLLVDNGADVKAKNNRGESCLHYKVSSDLTEYLILAGADIEAKDSKGQTPLFNAANLIDSKRASMKQENYQ
ncbi:UNVERIFIED_CONTAM: hypothetical protein HDU68_012614 [Siphonaria sp. JEL0065]|nr:hypothetical protein HDU68_012614 [Siphonaria sp. JEL0065]